jgi:hypothetical protein
MNASFGVAYCSKGLLIVNTQLEVARITVILRICEIKQVSALRMDLDTLRPILSGLIGGLVVYLFARSGRKPATVDGNRKVLAYGFGFKLFAALLVPCSLFVAYAAAHASSGQVILAACIAATFLAGAVFFAYHAFLVSFAYDETNIYYRSPIAGNHVIPWAAVRDVGYSGLVQSYYLSTPLVRRIWCSNMLIGYEELGAFISEKMQEIHGPER